jgi:membrane dipeptidase
MTAEGLDRDRARPFESAHDPQWIAESSALYQLTGVQLGLEDVAHPDDNTFEKALELLARSSYVYQRRHDLIHVAGFDDILRARESGRPCTIQHLAAVGCFADADDPIRNLDLFFALGVRMSQLTYFQQNRLCCSWCQQEDTGLTELGKQVVHRMNELGVMVDVAHCGHSSAMETVEASSEPVLISHTGCKAVYDDATNEQYLNAVFAQPYARGVPRPEKTGSRNAEDELLRAVAAKGGVAAFYTIGYVLGTGPELFDLWYRHLNHAIGVAGIDHVAIGTDRTFLPGWKPSPLVWTNWPYLTVGLVCRGHSDEEIRKILGANYLRYAERVLSKKPWGELMAPSGQRS